MDDLISRAVAIDALAKAMPSLTTPDGTGAFDHDIQITDEAFVDTMQIIQELPSAQPEIIRCKDCKYFERDIQRSWGTYNGCGVWTDDGNEIEVNQDDFCSYAERREE